MLSSVVPTSGSLRRLVAGVVVLGALGMPSLASAQVVNFESLSYGGACQWGGGSSFSSLGGKSWDGFRPLDLTNLTGACGRTSNTGYSSLLSANVGSVIAVGAGSAWLSSSSPFVLNSMVAGAGWQNPTSLTLTFYLNTVLKATQTISLNTFQTGASVFSGFYGGPTDFIGFTPDYSNGVDVFNSLAESCLGAGQGCVPQTYKSWFVDNLNFSPATVVVTPEPATVGMIGVGLLAMGLVRRRRRV